MTKLVGKISDGVFINMATPAKVKEIAARVREGAIEAGRDPNKIEIIAKSRVSLNPDKSAALKLEMAIKKLARIKRNC